MIKCSSLVKYYRSSIGLDKLDLAIDSGEIVGIFGVNGAGKSTLLKLIAGLILPTEGSTWIDGKKPSAVPERIAYITEAGSYFPSLDAAGHAEFMQRFYPRFNVGRYKKLIDFFGIPTDKKVRAMSKGQKAKLETAIGFSRGADILLLDEPFLGTDIVAKSDFLKSAAMLLDGETLLIATHDIDEVSNFIDRAVIIEHGKLAADRSVDDIRESKMTLKEFVADAAQKDRQQNCDLDFSD